jgi:transcriptional regulator with XRE-family HTH domain
MIITFKEVFIDLLDENNLNMKQFAEKSSIPYTTVVGWLKLGRLPDYTALLKISDFFNCSLDYLMGRQDNMQNDYLKITASKNEETLLKNYRQLPHESKEIVLELAKLLANPNEHKN